VATHDGSLVFTRLRQCVPHLMLPWAHRTPQPKRHLDQLSHYSTAHGSVVWRARTCPFSHGAIQTPPSNTRFLGPTESTPQMASQSVQPFCRAAEHGRFSHICQVAPMCTPCYTFPWAHPSSRPKRHLDWFCCF